MGTIFGSPGGHKAYEKWNRAAAPRKLSLSGAALESAVMNVARMFPNNVERGFARG